jgi:hypothetical protein
MGPTCQSNSSAEYINPAREKYNTITAKQTITSLRLRRRLNPSRHKLLPCGELVEPTFGSSFFTIR